MVFISKKDSQSLNLYDLVIVSKTKAVFLSRLGILVSHSVLKRIQPKYSICFIKKVSVSA